MSLKRRVDAVIDELEAAMNQLRDAIHGVPMRQGSFRSQHDNLARDVAAVLVMVETTLSRIPSN